MEVLEPAVPVPQHYDTTRVQVNFSDVKDTSQFEQYASSSRVPLFKIDGSYCLLLKDLADLWNYPSPYQLVAKLVKKSPLSKSEILKSDKLLNSELFQHGLIDNQNISYLYVNAESVYQSIVNKDALVYFEEDADIETKKRTPELGYDEYNEDKITLSHVFPSYGFVNSTIDLKHSTFNCLTNLSKYNYYKSIEGYGFLPLSKLLPSELENLYSINDYSKLELSKPDVIVQNLKKRKPLGKTKKSITNIDVNNLELKDTVIPGQGYIPEFSIDSFCKIVNYYVTNNQQTPTPHNSSGQSTTLAPSFLNFGKRNESKVTKQLAYNNDYENFNYNKYFYAKTYRGPGTGNYKDASLVNRINKIPTFANSEKVSSKRHLKNTNTKRYRLHLKGLTHEKFNKAYVEHILRKQRVSVADHDNMEMLHNTLQFNLLINTYRDISVDTWLNYFKFKFIDFEQLAEAKNNNEENAQSQQVMPGIGSRQLLKRFNFPQDYREITRKLPLELREEISNPLYFNMKTSESNNSQFLTNIDIIKLPNANMIGWDNLKKYRD